MVHGRFKVAVIGAGGWGTSLANLLAEQDCETSLWGRDPSILEEIERLHQNSRYLRGITLSPNIRTEKDLAQLITNSHILVSAIPTQVIRKVMEPFHSLLPGKIILNCSKGIELGSLCRISEIFSSLCPSANYAVLSGPSFALEVAKKLPTAVTVASRNKDVAENIQRLMSNSYFRIYTSSDVVGVEIGGALKNIVAIASGIVNGLQLGFNAEAALVNRGIAEIMRMGKHFGAEPLTFLGLSGVGDLILTSTGPLSRNRNLGVKLAKGLTLKEAQSELGGVAEGVYTTQSAELLSKKIGIEMPITSQIYSILYEGQAPKNALSVLMSRNLKPEWKG